MKKIFSFLILIFLTASVFAQKPTRIVKLPSGKSVKVLNITKMAFSEDIPALLLDYETDLKVSDLPALEAEVAEIFASFKIDVEKAGLSSAIIRAHEVPQGSGIFTKSKGYGFGFHKRKDGEWVKK